jgi:hypothetical protein
MLRRELARQPPRLPMNQTNESSCEAGSHQGRTAMEHAMTCGYQRHVRARARYAQTRMGRPPPHVHGKEGVDGSSPSEGFSKRPANRPFLLST